MINSSTSGLAGSSSSQTSWKKTALSRLIAVMSSIMASDDRARARRNALSAFVIRVVSAGLLFLLQIALARWMGTFQYGIYVFIWTWVLVLGGLSALGLPLIAMRLVPEYRETGQIDRLKRFAATSRGIAVGVGTLIALVGVVGITAFEDWITSYFVLPLYLALVCVPLYALTDMQDGLGRGHGWMGLALVPPYVLRPLVILAAMGVAYLAGLPMTATTAAVAAIIATWLSGLLQLWGMGWWTARLEAMGQGVPLSADGAASMAPVAARAAAVDDAGADAAGAQTRGEALHWLRLSAPLLAISACELLFQNTDVLVISAYLSPNEVGIYFAAAKTMSLILFVHYAVGSAVSHQFSALKARGDEEALKAFVSDAVGWTFWPSLFAALAILVLGQPLLWLSGPQFTQGYPVMMVLVVGLLFRSAMGPAEYLLNMLGEQGVCAAALIASAALNLALNLILVPMFGLMGAACATSISLAVAAVLQYLAARSRLGYDVAIWNHLRWPGPLKSSPSYV